MTNRHSLDRTSVNYTTYRAETDKKRSAKHLNKKIFEQDHTLKKTVKHVKTKRIYSSPKQSSSTAQRDKAWKRKPTVLNRNKRCTPGRPLYLRKAIERAKLESYNIHKQRQRLCEKHNESLDRLLESNGLQRDTVEGDGNCFFNSIIASTDKFQTAQELRNCVCKHLRENFKVYKAFLTFDNSKTEEEQHIAYKVKVEFLEGEGHWSNDLADCLPLAVSNVLGRTVKIYCSNRTNPVYEVQPSDTTHKEEENALNLAYLQVPGYEHYDACTPSGQKTKAQQNETPISSDSSASITHGSITPRKQAEYISPKKFKGKRKRMAQPHLWKKNIRKHERLHGRSYISATGKKIDAKEMKPVTCKCRWFKCKEKFTDEERLEYFTAYWNLNSYERQRDFICANVTEGKPERIRTDARRRKTVSRAYFFDQKRVCKSFFLNTLDIGERTVDRSLRSKRSGTFATTDKRGKHAPHNITPDIMVEDIRKHIESFPVLEAHYTRKDTNRKFLGQDLNIRKMYSLYKEECKNKGKRHTSESKYRAIFCNEYNYAFHVPKKDQCATCVVYKQKEIRKETSSELREEYEQHCKNKERAREEKRFDKLKAVENSNYHVATFDLQKVLQIPCSLVSQVYYKRKLSCYNLSFYSLKDSQATCYLWNETEGQRGSCEIATCLLTYIKSLPSNVDHVTFYSDCCTGQNRNRFVAIALLHAVNRTTNIQTIDHKFLESGHTQMESDSIHAAIETAKKCTEVFVPSQWDTVIRLARKRRPYTVVPLKYFDFLNLKPLANSLLSANAVDAKGQRVSWMKIRWFQFRKSDPHDIFFKYQFDGEFQSIKIKSSRKTKAVTAPLPQLYTTKLPVSSAKKADLVSLCSDGTIPSEFHTYIKTLPDSNTIRDRLPDPDIIEDDVDSDAD